WAAGRIPQAKLIEAGALPAADLDLPHDRLIATHCGHGQRAATGLSVLEHRGYRNLAVITEGVDDWREAGGKVQQGAPSEPQAARAGARRAPADAWVCPRTGRSARRWRPAT